MAVKVIRDDGFLTLYNGLSASCLRQATYTTTRFAIYGGVKSLKSDSTLSFVEKISLAAGSGAIGAFVGSFDISLNAKKNRYFLIKAHPLILSMFVCRMTVNYQKTNDEIINMLLMGLFG
jgi:hypothetical protein